MGKVVLCWTWPERIMLRIPISSCEKDLQASSPLIISMLNYFKIYYIRLSCCPVAQKNTDVSMMWALGYTHAYRFLVGETRGEEPFGRQRRTERMVLELREIVEI